MADRSIVLRLKADVADAIRGIRQVKDEARTVGDESGKVTRRLADHARENRDAWTTVGGSLSVVGGALTGMSALVLKTGIGYNTLQQTSRAALSTILGGTEAANAQMDRLDDFARNSPFAKDVFIRAQQQLLGFGMEAEKVVPTLDAIQNAVAATGGSNQDIAELTRIIAQVGAAGKITAVDLMQFGQRGVDAATLIGSQMGKTGAQIREEITAGTLDADAAIDALVAGMQQKFGGAAAGVKDTMAGALDRVKAAFRDLASSAMSLLVDPNGGGLLVDGLNSIADAIRSFENLPTPIRDTAVALGLIAGPAALAAGGFLLLAPRAIDTWDALSRMGRAGELAQTGLTKVGRAARNVLGPIVALKVIGEVADHFLAAEADLALLENRLVTAGGAAQDFFTRATLTDEFMMSDDQVARANATVEALERITDPGLIDRVDGARDSFARFFSDALGDASASEYINFKRDIEDLDAVLAGLAQKGLPEASAAFRTWGDSMGGAEEVAAAALKAMPGFRAELTRIATEAGIAANEQNLLNLALGKMPTPLLDIEGKLGEMAGALVEAYQAEQDLTNETNLLQEAAEEAAASHERLVASLLKMVDNAFNAEQAAIDWQKALADLNATIKENGKNTDLSTEAGRNNRQALLNLAQQALATAEANLANGDSLFQVKKDMEDARAAFIRGAEQMGYTTAEANELADQLGLTDENVNTLSASIERIPSKHVNVTVGGVEDATANVQTLQRTINGVKGKTVTVTVNWAERGRRPGRYLDHVGVATGGYMRDVLGFAGGGWPRRAGLIQGPGGPTDDLVPARLSRDEFVTRAAAVKKAGVDAMYAINSGRFSRSALRAALGLADGGTPWAPAMPSATTQVPAVASAGPTFNITNVYPQAEPTSKTVQRASQHQAAAGRY